MIVDVTLDLDLIRTALLDMLSGLEDGSTSGSPYTVTDVEAELDKIAAVESQN